MNKLLINLTACAFVLGLSSIAYRGRSNVAG